MCEKLTNRHIATLDAFWRREGAHQTKAVPEYTDWNAKFIQAMVEVFEPIETTFQLRSEEIFQQLDRLVRGYLSRLEVDLRGM